MGYDPNYTPPPEIQQISQQMEADPQVVAARQRYLRTQNQADFIAYLDAARPFLSKIDQTHYGLDPATGQINHTSNYGHLWKMAAGMAAGVVPYATVPGTAAGAATAAGGGAGAAGAIADITKVADAASKAGSAVSGGMDIAKLIASLGSIVPALMATRETSADKDLKSQQNDILKLQADRMRQQDPLFQSTQRGLQAMLPIFSRNGGQ